MPTVIWWDVGKRTGIEVDNFDLVVLLALQPRPVIPLSSIVEGSDRRPSEHSVTPDALWV